jgi:ribosome-binding factor A
MKFTPELEFRPDGGVVEGERIEGILRQLSEEALEEG